MHRLLTSAAALMLVAAACGGASQPATSVAPSVSPTTAPLAGSITVFAGSSLTDAFKKAGDQLKAKNPGIDFVFNFGSSSTLATQIINLAPADVFASADDVNMQKIVDAKLNETAPAIFLSNRLQIAVAAGNPKQITGLADLARSGLIVVLAAPTVPAGRYALEALQKAGVTVRPASQEVDVRAVLNKVTLGEADAGIVYVTDVRSAGAKVAGVDIPEQHQVIARYPIAVVKESKNPRLAQAYVDYLLSDDGQKLLAEFGFSKTVRAARPPLAIAVLAAIGVAFFALPLAGLIYRVSWQTALSDLVTPDSLNALRLSMLVSIAATALGLVLGVPLAWIYARVAFPGRNVVRALTTLPMVLPPVVGGVALLVAFGRRGLVGEWLDAGFGLRIPFTTAATVMAATFVSMPFLVLTVEAGIRSIDRRYEEAARTLGASQWRIFRQVTLPLIAPSLFAGAVLCWARALGEFGATITFAGNLPGTTQTLPLAVYIAMETRPETAIVLSLVLLLVSLGVLVALRDRYLRLD